MGEDIVLLAIHRNGTIIAYEKLRFALAGWELVRLAETRRIDIDHDGYIVVVDNGPTGDAIVDSALAAIDNAIGQPRAKEWVARQRSTLAAKYLERLAAAGTIRAGRRKALGLLRAQRWTVVDKARGIDAKDRLDEIAFSTGPVTPEQAAFAGLVHAVGLDARLYPKRKNLAARNRLQAVAQEHQTIGMFSDSSPSLNNPGDNSIQMAPDAGLNFAALSAVQSCVHATHHAAADHGIGHDGGSHHGGAFHHDGGGMGGGHHG